MFSIGEFSKITGLTHSPIPKGRDFRLLAKRDNIATDFDELNFKWRPGRDTPSLRDIAAASITTGGLQSTTTMVRNSRVYT